LLRPSKRVNDLIAGVLALAEEHYDVEVVAFVALSNHFHALLIPADGQELSRFMQFLKSNIARELNRVLQRTGAFWERRYTATWIPYSPAKMEARFRYLLSQGVKENLVARVVQWPGIHFGRNLINSQPITGVWVDRTKAWELRRQGKEPTKAEILRKTSLELAPLPCWKELSVEERRQKTLAMILEIEAEARAIRKQTGKRPLGVERIRKQKPFSTPMNPVKPSRAPQFHAEGATFILYRHAYRNFGAAFRQAAELQKQGKPAKFPVGAFPPGLPYVRGKPPPVMSAA
jgi:REP element-mobilizing transposase RayT